MSYNDAKYNVIERKWFGLTKKWGGDCATGYIMTAVDSATTLKHMDSGYYPKGPIRIVKWGAMVLATVTATKTVDLLPTYLQLGTAAKVGRMNLRAASQKVFFGTVAAIDVADGKAIKIAQATPTTSAGTAAILGTQGGTVAFFIDYVRRYDSTNGNWDF